MRERYAVGLTGGIGAGKSTVAAALAARGAVIVDADAIARQVVEPGGPALAPIAERFGDGVIGPDGRLDRAALAGIVFADESARQRLSDITHPIITAEMWRQVDAAPLDRVLVLDVPLLVEDRRPAKRSYDLIVVVEAPLDVKLVRLVERGMSSEDALARMAVQATDEERRARANVVVDNSGARDHLVPQIDALWARIQAGQQSKSRM